MVEADLENNIRKHITLEIWDEILWKKDQYSRPRSLIDDLLQRSSCVSASIISTLSSVSNESLKSVYSKNDKSVYCMFLL